MRRALILLTLGVLSIPLIGCQATNGRNAQNGCQQCGEFGQRPIDVIRPSTCRSADCQAAGTCLERGDCLKNVRDGVRNLLDRPCRQCGVLGCKGLACRNPLARLRANRPPPVSTVSYPYYTLHGPRDFLTADPNPLGP